MIERTRTNATHTGEFNGIPATGKQVGWTEIHIYRLVDGKIAEQWSEIDLLGLLVQLERYPEPRLPLLLLLPDRSSYANSRRRSGGSRLGMESSIG